MRRNLEGQSHVDHSSPAIPTPAISTPVFPTPAIPTPVFPTPVFPAKGDLWIIPSHSGRELEPAPDLIRG